MYEYRAKITDVYDADTVTAEIDLGFKSCLKKVKLRLYGINAPEVRGPERPEGLDARDWLRERILNQEVFIRTYKDKAGKYGRWLADIYPRNDHSVSYNEMLVESGHAEEADY